MNIQQADYKAQPIEELTGNPLIEALPLLGLTAEERSKRLNSRNHITADERELLPELRICKLPNISKIFVPTNWGLRLSQNLDLLIRESYRRRNPLNNVHLRQAYRIETGSLGDLPDLGDPVGSTFLIGQSGMGKTTTVLKYLSNYPQLIRHERYGDVPLNIYQIVYLSVDVPADGSVKNFCLQFLQSIDEVLETSYRNNHRRCSIGELTALIAELCCMYHIGLIVIDECQNLLRGNYGRERLSEFLNVLSNKVGCPFCLIGTPPSKQLLEGTFHLCRRFESKGSITLNPYTEDSQDWQSFVQILWTDGLYLKGENELTEELRGAFHACSAGIPAVAKNLFYDVQRVILEDPNREEKITKELIEKTAKAHFPNIENKVRAILNNDYARLYEMGDGLTEQSYDQPKTKERVRRTGEQKKREDEIFFLLNQIGYREMFSKQQLKQQARLIALEIGPEVHGVELTTQILAYMKAYIEEKQETASEDIQPTDLEEDIAHVDRFF